MRDLGVPREYHGSTTGVPQEYCCRAFTEDFRKPVLVGGEDTWGQLQYYKTTQQILEEAQ